mmetsp:Transcript_32951/g.72275  ORF Transcript_32951/g.72275 Transcript_32951/m.72275 type:complete len:191 (+) Transcript_32951:65-637(+)
MYASLFRELSDVTVMANNDPTRNTYISIGVSSQDPAPLTQIPSILPLNLEPRHHKVLLQSLSNLKLDTVQAGTAAGHLDGNAGLEAGLAGNADQIDIASGHAKERPNPIEHNVDLLLAELRSLRHGLDDFLNFRYAFPKSSLESHLHGLRRGWTGSAGTLELQPDHWAVDFVYADVSTVLDEVGSHLLED